MAGGIKMNKNDILTGKIEDLTVEGEGISKIDGMPFFIKDTVIGDEVKFVVTKLKKNYGYGKVLEVLVPSKDRVTPACPIAKRCGGCQLQSMNYEAQLAFKHSKVRNNLRRLGGFSDELLDKVMEPALGCELPFGYRNKAQYPFGKDREGRTVCGFFAPRSHTIIPNTDCALGASVNKVILEKLLELMEKYGIAPYDEETGRGLVRHALIRTSSMTGEVMVCIVINGSSLPHSGEIVSALTEIPEISSISININTEKTNVILGNETRTVYGDDFIVDEIRVYNTSNFTPTGESLAFEISPASFYQVNPTQTGKLYSLALDYAGLTGNETVWDLYCGIGTISLFMARRAGKVYGVEVVPSAVENARVNAKNNGVGNAEFRLGKAEDLVSDLPRPDVICVDPPRKGCDERCLSVIVDNAPEKIVYVSCDSATLARDLRYLCDHGYALVRARAVDQFPQSVHVETCAQLVRTDF